MHYLWPNLATNNAPQIWNIIRRNQIQSGTWDLVIPNVDIEEVAHSVWLKILHKIAIKLAAQTPNSQNSFWIFIHHAGEQVFQTNKSFSDHTNTYNWKEI